jgi:MFS family permease
VIAQANLSALRAALTSPPSLIAALAVCISINFQILLPVVPVLVERGSTHGAAGAATAALFIGAVIGELASPWLMTRQRSMHLLVAGQLLAGLPSLVYVIPHAAVPLMLPAASARGIGFGVSIVVSVALLSELTPPHQRGSSIGYYGLALGAPGIVVPSIGVALLGSGLTWVAALIGLGGGLLGAFFATRIPGRSVQVSRSSTNLRGAIRRPGLLMVVVGFVLASGCFGGVVTYTSVALPLSGLGSAASFFLLSGITRAAFRWLAGVLGDRLPTRIVLIGSVALLLAGLLSLAVRGGVVTVLVAALAYGAGYGATQTVAFLAMSERGTRSDLGAISALWNAAIDLGASLGGTAIGLAAASFGYGAAVWVLPAAAVLSLPLFLWPAGAVGHPPGVEPGVSVR